jgi:ankyrin repeat protein
MLKYNFNLNDNDYMNQTPLFYTAKEGQVQASEMLIESGCDVNHKDTHGQTALFYAARFGRL